MNICNEIYLILFEHKRLKRSEIANILTKKLDVKRKDIEKDLYKGLELLMDKGIVDKERDMFWEKFRLKHSNYYFLK